MDLSGISEDIQISCVLKLFRDLFLLIAGGDFPHGSGGEEFTCNSGHTGSMSPIPGSRRSSGEANGNPLQYSCLGNPLDRGTWWATGHGVTKESDTTE